VLGDALEEFAARDIAFTRRHEGRARRLIADTLSFVTLTSIREVVSERDRKIDEYTGRLERTNHELKLKQRLVNDLYESRMHITRSVVHDLRNFLNAFALALQLIGQAPSKADKALTLANRQAADMKQLIDQMVEYSVVLGDGAGLTLEHVELRELYDELVTSSRPAIEAKRIRLCTAFDPALSGVTSNRLRLKQIAVNLLSNATKYTTSGEIELAFATAVRSTGRSACPIPVSGLRLRIRTACSMSSNAPRATIFPARASGWRSSRSFAGYWTDGSILCPAKALGPRSKSVSR
jgi:signal transduction histidine kinase